MQNPNAIGPEQSLDKYKRVKPSTSDDVVGHAFGGTRDVKSDKMPARC